MKVCYIRDVLRDASEGKYVEVLGWVASKRDLGGIIFIDLVDSTGKIQCVLTASSDAFLKARRISPESSVKLRGALRIRKPGIVEIETKDIEIIGDVSLCITPAPRSQFDIFKPSLINQILSKRHLYLRNEKMTAIFKFTHKCCKIIRNWFDNEGFTEVHPPILTELLLYENEASAFKVNFFGREVFLTQCVAFYLESAIYAFERVYSINPSFRAEKLRSRRNSAEFWHLKAEMAFADLEDVITFVERMFSFVIKQVRSEGRDELEILGVDLDADKLTRVPYPRITYVDALRRLRELGINKEFGRSLGNKDEMLLSKEFDSPFWIVGLPRSVEPFPYRIEPSDPRVTKTADLIATDGFGELLGAAEKIWQLEELIERMKEKRKDTDMKYDWYRELRQVGSVPHSGFGMGIERLIRWLLRLRHVRDATLFPRLFGRRPNP